MKALVYDGPGKIEFREHPTPKLQADTDIVMRISRSTICGTDAHIIKGGVPTVKPGTVLGHEATGVVTEVGSAVQNVAPGDRILAVCVSACGYCRFCTSRLYGQCLHGGWALGNTIDGVQAEYARIPYAHTNMVPIPPGVSDEQALMVSDILPTAWFGARLAEVGSGDVVLVLGAGPVGQLAVLSARMQGAGRVLIVDGNADRLETARLQNAETIDFNAEDPVKIVAELTGGIGPDRVIDAVGVDAQHAHAGPAGRKAAKQEVENRQEQKALAPEINPQGEDWHPGDAPSQALRWAVECLAKAGTLSIIGVYPQTAKSFPIGEAMNKNLTIKMGNCNHRKYIPMLVDMVRSGEVEPAEILTQHEPLGSAIDAYKAFDERRPGWLKVKLEPAV
jgi:threonine dehydrogenase-like Zn-dependent dehydrogenase